MCGPSAVPRMPRRWWRAMMRLPTWSVCPRKRYLEVEEKSRVFSRFLLGGHAPARRRSCRASALGVCAFAFMPIVVLVPVFCGARVPANGLGAYLTICSFLGCGREYSGEYVSTSTSTSTSVRRQRTAVFGHAPDQRHRNVALRIVLTLVRTYDDCSLASFSELKSYFTSICLHSFNI